jgi:hypothetical protein
MNPEVPSFIAFEDFVWIKRDASEVPIEIRIGIPYQVSEFEWACPAILGGVDSRYPDMRGETSLQALCLALKLVSTRLGHLLEQGERIVYSSDHTQSLTSESLDSIFGLNRVP